MSNPTKPSKSLNKLTDAYATINTVVMDTIAEAVENLKIPPVVLPIYRGDEEVTTIPGYVNPQIHKIITVAEQGLPICLFGGSGVGKTTLAEQVAEALELPFYCQTVTAGMPESTLLGRQILNETGGMTYATTPFLEAVEKGGLFLLDEFDAIDENCALSINNLLEFGKLDIPMRTENPRVVAHPNFRFVACANTMLNGASLIHNGRNQLDGATISRFDGGIFEIGYDEKLENMLCPTTIIREMFLAVRATVLKHNLRKEISTRTLKRAEILWHTGVWKSPTELLEHFLRNWSPSELAVIQETFNEDMKKLKAEMDKTLISDKERQEQLEASEAIAKSREASYSKADKVAKTLELESDE